MTEHERIWEKASTLVEYAGPCAPAYASKWARQLLEAGDVEARADWIRVMVACKALLAKEARPPRRDP